METPLFGVLGSWVLSYISSLIDKTRSTNKDVSYLDAPTIDISVV